MRNKLSSLLPTIGLSYHHHSGFIPCECKYIQFEVMIQTRGLWRSRPTNGPREPPYKYIACIIHIIEIHTLWTKPTNSYQNNKRDSIHAKLVLLFAMEIKEIKMSLNKYFTFLHVFKQNEKSQWLSLARMTIFFFIKQHNRRRRRRRFEGFSLNSFNVFVQVITTITSNCWWWGCDLLKLIRILLLFSFFYSFIIITVLLFPSHYCHCLSSQECHDYCCHPSSNSADLNVFTLSVEKKILCNSMSFKWISNKQSMYMLHVLVERWWEFASVSEVWPYLPFLKSKFKWGRVYRIIKSKES